MKLPAHLKTLIDVAAQHAGAAGRALITPIDLLQALQVEHGAGLPAEDRELGQQLLQQAPSDGPAGEAPGELDDELKELLARWTRGEGGQRLDPESLHRLLLMHWQEQGEAQGDTELDEEAFLQALFHEELNLNRRFGEEPMQGLLEYHEYLPAMMEVLIRRYRQNLLIYGARGSGRHAVLRRLIENTQAGRVPELFRERVFYEFSAEIFLGGLDDRAELIHRFELLSAHLDRHRELVLVTDQLPGWLGSDNPLLQDFVNRLFAMMDTRSHHFVLLADLGFYNGVYRTNPALMELLAPVYVAPMGRQDVIRILEQVRERFEQHYRISVEDRHLAAVVEAADEHLYQLHFPKKALILLDVTLSILALRPEHEREWDQALSLALIRVTGQALRHYPDLEERLAGLEPLLRDRVIGQQRAVAEICRSLRFQKSELDLEPERPDGVYLLAGPSGVGKQVLVDELSLHLYGRKPFVIDLQEYHDPESLAQLTGQGGEAPSLARALAEMPRCVLLLKNLEYAAPEILQYLLQSIRRGRIRDAAGEETWISELTVILLSDLPMLDTAKRPMGFVEGEGRDPYSEEGLKDYFTPELLRAVDKLVPFQPLDEQALREILRRRLLPALCLRLERLGHRLEVPQEVLDHIARYEAGPERSASELARDFRRLLAVPVNEALQQSSEKLSLAASLEEGEIRVKQAKQG